MFLHQIRLVPEGEIENYKHENANLKAVLETTRRDLELARKERDDSHKRLAAIQKKAEAVNTLYGIDLVELLGC